MYMLQKLDLNFSVMNFASSSEGLDRVGNPTSVSKITKSGTIGIVLLCILYVPAGARDLLSNNNGVKLKNLTWRI